MFPPEEVILVKSIEEGFLFGANVNFTAQPQLKIYAVEKGIEYGQTSMPIFTEVNAGGLVLKITLDTVQVTTRLNVFVI